MRPPTACAISLPRGFAISLGLAAAEPQLSCRVRGAQIAAFIRNAPRAMVANLLAGTLLLLALRGGGRLHGPIVAWFCLFGAAWLKLGQCWLKSRWRVRAPHAASRKAIRRAVLHGLRFGALWGALPIITGDGSIAAGQMIVAGLTAGMVLAGSLTMASVPAAGLATIALTAAGATCAVLRHAGSPDAFGLLAMIWAYAGMAAVCLCTIAHLFVENVLVTARLQAEIAARENAQAELAHAGRTSVLGVGVAHDFNNILQSVTGNAKLLARRDNDAQQIRQLAGSILDAAARGRAISRRLLAFARQESLAAEPVDVYEILNNAAGLLEHALPPSIRLAITAAPDLPPALSDRAQFETVLVNLAANARDAMPWGGTLCLHAVAEMVEARGKGHKLPPGRYLRITVTDNGTGMDAATLARAADAFFTTKPEGKGTGLGLPLAKNFAEQSAGAFAIASEPGLGTVVTLWLPQANTAPPARFTPEALLEHYPTTWGHPSD